MPLRGREVISTQPMSKTLARHPLVLLDQQLKWLAKETTMPYKNNRVSNVEEKRMNCWKCDGHP
jgi:hypothetical protein